MPSWSDKLLQEVIRLLLEAFYEPGFNDHSHGFRPGRGCHTALREIHHNWVGSVWFVEGDIQACFDSFGHETLLSILRERSHDERFLRLISRLLQAGYLEDWRYHATYSGPAYIRLRSASYRLKKMGRWKEAKRMRRRMQQLPSLDPLDPNYRRLRSCRYADDVLCGYAGSRQEAEEIKRQRSEFLRDTLKLTLSEEKTLITHARTERARFLGYDIPILHNNQKHDRRGHRSSNGQIALPVPKERIQEKCAPFLKHGKPMLRKERTNDTVYSIVAQFQQEYRGFVEDYQLALNRSHLKRLKWVMERSLVAPLSRKLRVRVSHIYRRYQTTIQTPEGPRKVLQVTVEREGKNPLVAHWGGITLARHSKATLKDQPSFNWSQRSELEKRLLAQRCELCGSPEQIQVHHIRALKDLQRNGQAEKPRWVSIMAARHRKTLITCQKCHNDIHAGRADGRYKLV